MITEPEARRLLNNVTNGAADDFMDGQWAAIDTIVNGRGRLLLIQRTGWGKSMVYFLSTRILRDAGAGPTLIVSPLLALMRNQQAAASRLGLSVESINTTNSEDWDKIIARIRMNAVDVVLVSPERLANAAFMETCLAPIIDRIAFFAVDEAHCISDWGHNFRPDYRRIHQVLRRLPEDAAVLATTATANSRVVTDVLAQLGPDTVLQRGPLARDSLQLQTLRLPGRAARLAWLAAALPQLPGSGIVYALTTRDAEGVTAWLRSRRIDAHAYHGQVDEVLTTGRQELEAKLVANQLKVLVATNALGMGFDKPDLGWVIHFQAPQSLIHYYQQVGRAGRGIPTAVGVLMGGEEDHKTNRFFIANAAPAERDINRVLGMLAESETGLTADELSLRLKMKTDRVDRVLKLLSVLDDAPIAKAETRWLRTVHDYRVDTERTRGLVLRHEQEWHDVQRYLGTRSCLMRYLGRAMDDPAARSCGRCANCRRRPILSIRPDAALIAAAEAFISHSNGPTGPRLDPMVRRDMAGARHARRITTAGRTGF